MYDARGDKINTYLSRVVISTDFMEIIRPDYWTGTSPHMNPLTHVNLDNIGQQRGIEGKIIVSLPCRIDALDRNLQSSRAGANPDGPHGPQGKIQRDCQWIGITFDRDGWGKKGKNESDLELPMGESAN